MRLFALAIALLAGCGDPCASRFEAGAVEEVWSGPVSFRRTVAAANLCGPAYVTAGDLQGEGMELVVSVFGRQDGTSVPNGSVIALRSSDSGWQQETLLSPRAGLKWPNEAALEDVDGDGDLDLTLGVGFLTCLLSPWTAPCGGLGWLEQGDGWTWHAVVPAGDALFYHRGALLDLDGDGRRDLVTVGESTATPVDGEDRAQTLWFRGTDGPDAFDPTPLEIGAGLGSLFSDADLDGDGDADLLSAQYFDDRASFAWFEQTEAPTPETAGGWAWHALDATSGPAIQLSAIPDLYGDGQTVLVGSNHVNNGNEPPDPWAPAVFAFTPGEDPRDPWQKTTLVEGFQSTPGVGVGAPGVFDWGDLDGDGDLDLLLSGDGDPRLWWLEQVSPGSFEGHVLEDPFGQAAVKVADLDGDGQVEAIGSSYDENAVVIYQVVP